MTAAIWTFFAEPLGYDFMQRALLVAIVVGAVSAVLSCFLVLKGWSLMGDAIAHAVLPGIVIAFVIGLPIAIGAFAAGLFAAISTGYLKDNSRIKEDTAMGIVFTGMFAVGLVLFSRIETDQHLNHILFGDMLGVSWADLAETTVIAGVTLAILLAKRRDFLLHAFDPQHARAIGLPVQLLHYGLLAMLSVTIVAALQAVGIILVVAMLIAPGATGFLLARRFGTMLAIALGTALVSGVLGVFISYAINAASGPSVVLIQSLFFLLALLFAPGHGLLRRKRTTAPVSPAP